MCQTFQREKFCLTHPMSKMILEIFVRWCVISENVSSYLNPRKSFVQLQKMSDWQRGISGAKTFIVASLTFCGDVFFFAKWHIMLLQSFKMWCNAFGFYHIPMTSRLPWISLLPFMIEVQKKNCASSTDIIVHLIFLGAKIHLCSQDNGSLQLHTCISDRQKDTKKSPTRIGDVWMDNGNISKW